MPPPPPPRSAAATATRAPAPLQSLCPDCRNFTGVMHDLLFNQGFNEFVDFRWGQAAHGWGMHARPSGAGACS